MFGHLSGDVPEEGQICYGSFVWVIIFFLPFWAVRATPRCHGARLQMHALSNLAPAVPLTRFFRSLVETALPRKRDAFWIRFCRIRSVRMLVQKAISHQPAAPTTSKQNDQSRGAHRGTPRRQSAVCGLVLSTMMGRASYGRP